MRSWPANVMLSPRRCGEARLEPGFLFDRDHVDARPGPQAAAASFDLRIAFAFFRLDSTLAARGSGAPDVEQKFVSSHRPLNGKTQERARRGV